MLRVARRVNAPTHTAELPISRFLCPWVSVRRGSLSISAVKIAVELAVLPVPAAPVRQKDRPSPAKRTASSWFSLRVREGKVTGAVGVGVGGVAASNLAVIFALIAASRSIVGLLLTASDSD